MYKSILVGNSDHVPQVIAQALEKLGLEEEDPKRYSLVQVLPHKELKFPPNANVFYALDTSGPPGDVRLEVRPMVGGFKSSSTSVSMSNLHLSPSSASSTNNNNNNCSKVNQNRPKGFTSISKNSNRSNWNPPTEECQLISALLSIWATYGLETGNCIIAKFRDVKWYY